MPYEELTSFFLTVEDIYFNEQERSNKKIEEFLEKGLSEAKTANDAKYLFEEIIRLFVQDLPDYADVVWAATPFLPKCLEEKIRMKAYLKKSFKRVIHCIEKSCG